MHIITDWTTDTRAFDPSAWAEKASAYLDEIGY